MSVSFPTNSSGSSNSVDRDEIIDEMQSKIGELLKCNQDLCTVKNQNEILKDQIVQQQKEYGLEIKTLKDRISELQTTSRDFEEKINNLTEQNELLANQNLTTKQNYDDVTRQFETFKKMAENEYNSKLIAQTSELKAQCENQIQKISELSEMVKEYKNKDKTNTELIIKQTKEIEQLKNKNGLIGKELSECQQKNQKNLSLVSELTKSNHLLQQNVNEAKIENDKNLGFITELSDLKQKNDNIISTQARQIDELVKKLSGYQSINQKLKNSHELKEYLDKKKQIVKVLRGKYIKLRNENINMKKKFNDQVIAIEHAANDLSDVQENAFLVQQQFEETQIAHSNAQKMIEKLETRNKIGKAILKANTFLMRNISAIETKINADFERPSFRSIILSALMLKRWRMLIGFQKSYENDTRNWWFLVPPNSVNNSVLGIIEHRYQVDREQNNEIQNLNEIVAKLTDINKTDSENIQQYKEQINAQSEEINEFKQKTEELDNQIEAMVEGEQFELVATKYMSAKASNKTLKELVRKQEKEIQSLTEQVQCLDQHRRIQHNRLKLSSRTTEQIKNQLTNAHDKIGQLTVELDYRDRENLALERHLNNDQIVESRLRTNCITMAHYNGKVITCDKPDYQKCKDGDIKAKLREMSQNLINDVYKIS